MATQEPPLGSDRTRSLRARLDALLRRPLPGGPDGGAAGADRADTGGAQPAAAAGSGAGSAGRQAGGLAPLVYRRDLPHREAVASGGAAAARSPAPVGRLAGTEVRHERCGAAWLVRTPLAELPGMRGYGEAFAACLEHADGPVRTWLGACCGSDEAQPTDVVFVDLETAGLGNAPLFLIGAMAWAGDGLEARQYLARTYAEEAAAIALFLQDHQRQRIVVTFNGKSFDLPFLRVRAAATGVPFAWEPLHLDLLHAARRAWGDLLADCRLQTLERCICGRTRPADIPGHLIPEVYHTYVRTGDDGQMVEVLRHNLLDLVTLAELTARFPGV